MKKTLLFLVCAMMIILTGCDKTVEYDQPEGHVCDMSGYGYETENFYYINLDTMFDLMDQKKTFIVFLAHLGCPWCEELLPVLDRISVEKEMKVYYLNSLSDETVKDQEGLDKLLELASEYVTEEDGKPVLWAPSIFYVQQGKIIDVHEGTVNTHPARERKMTEKEVARLEYNLRKEFDALLVRK
ncbi:MAG: hypothetical protein IKE12_09555 [Erysipelotrichaceae bacterium]|nr:hypothetical protein [Erysipelotrichaceae bacterium]